MTLFQQIHAVAAKANVWHSQMMFHGHIPPPVDFMALCQPAKCKKTTSTSPLPLPRLLPICDYNKKLPFPFQSGDSFKFDPTTYPDCSKCTRVKLMGDIIESARLAGFKLRRRGKESTRLNFKCAHNKLQDDITKREFDAGTYQQAGTKVTSQRSKSSRKPKSLSCTKTINAPRPSGKNLHKKKGSIQMLHPAKRRDVPLK